MESSAEFSVVVGSIPEDNAQAKQILADQLDLHKIDLQRSIHHLPGIVAKNLTEQKAVFLKQLLTLAGCEVVIAETASLPDVEHAPHVHHVRCEANGLELLDVKGEPTEVIEWSAFYFLAIGNIPIAPGNEQQAGISVQTHGTTGVHDAILKSQPKAPELWLASSNPDHCLRFDEREMNYEYLGERLTSSGTKNFELFVRDLVNFAPHMTLTDPASAYLDGKSVLTYNYESADDFRHIVQAQMVIARDAIAGSDE